ncbi:hypothetical protein IGI04_016307, partial [Brassica rapa subsp. trilocularis]
ECLRNLRNRIKGSTDQEPQSPVVEDQVVKMNHMVTSLAKTFKSPLVDTIQSILQHQQKTAETEEARTKKLILSSSLKCMG